MRAHVNGRNFDYPQPLEGRMAKSYLWSIERDARQLRKQLHDDDDLPGWVQAKIVTAQDRIQTVERYLGHKIARAEAMQGVQAQLNPSCACRNPSKSGTALLALAVGLTAGYYLSRRF